MKEFLETCGSNLPSSEGQMIIDPQALLKSEIKRSEALFIMVKFIADWIIEQETDAPEGDSELLADAMKLLNVAGMWKPPVDDQWRESYADLWKRYKSAKINPETGDEL